MLLAIAGTANAQTCLETVDGVRPGGSADVLFSFPKDPQQLSVDQGGALVFGLNIPVFPGFLAPQLVASYSSRGGDGIMGMGWNIQIPAITVDLGDSLDALELRPDQQMELAADGRRYLRNRWIAHPGGALVCEEDLGKPGWEASKCVTNPRGATRFVPLGGSKDGFETGFQALDPNEGLVQSYGSRPASRIEGPDGRTVAWLIDTEENRLGHQIRHYYEEPADSNERRRVAIQMAGNKVIRFIYGLERERDRRTDYALATERSNERLLTEIRLLDNCEPIQLEKPDNITVDFGPCGDDKGTNPNRVQVIKLAYWHATSRHTGRYTLRSWHRMSGDESTCYRPVEFEYNGDLQPTLVSGNLSEPAPSQDHLRLPDGHLLPSQSSHVPFQNIVDFNRDGIPDLVHRKESYKDFWPDAYSTNHKLYVSHGNGSGGFGGGGVYDEPLVAHAVWLHKHWTKWEVQLPPDYDLADSVSKTYDPGLIVPPDAVAGLAQTVGWPADPDDPLRAAANIGINTKPWMAQPGVKNTLLGAQPLFKGLSMTIECWRLGSELCQQIEATYACVWEDNCDCLDDLDDCEAGEPYLEGGYDTDVSVKIADYMDMDGDGYLDRVVSGLIVIWEKENETQWRDPANAPPALFVSRYDPELDDFLPFERYDIAAPSGEFSRLTPAFLSALAVEVKRNGEPGASDLSNHSAPAAVVEAVGLAMDARSLASALGALSPNASTWASVGLAVETGQFMLSSLNLLVRTAGARPEMTQGLAYAQTVGTLMQKGMIIGDALRGMRQTSEIVSRFRDLGWISKEAASTTLAKISAQGWAAISGAIAGVMGIIINTAVVAGAKKRMKTPGYNAAAVAANTQLTTTVVSIASISLGTYFLVVGASGPLAAGTAILGGVIALALTIANWAGKTGDVEWEEGLDNFKFRPKRGLRWLDSSVAHHVISTKTVLNWVDLSGNGRLDCVVSRFSELERGFAFAGGDVDVDDGWATSEWRAWDFESGFGPDLLSESHTQVELELRHVHRADQTDLRLGLLDMNGDGRADLVHTHNDGIIVGTQYAPKVYLNTGRGFAPVRTWNFTDGGASAPGGCRGNSRVMMSRSRNLSWTESVSKKKGYNVGLNNVTQLIIDVNQDKLPDVVIKDELSYSWMGSPNDCNLLSPISVLNEDVCDDPLPVVGEPGWPNGNEPCKNDGTFTWWADFDNGQIDGYREGESHLTEAAEQIYSPRHEGIHYVAFNNGEGFDPYVPLDEPLPSFGGGITVVDITNPEVTAVPDYAMSGTSNVLGDFVGTGQIDLLAMDINDPTIDCLSTCWPGHPVYRQDRLGIPNPDALVAVNYPEGGRADIQYELLRDIGGEQGPPIWVVSRVDFDDRVTTDLFGAATPYVEYAYRGAKLRDREFLGFESVGETRFTGDHMVQLVQQFAQEGPERGMPVCSEVRGRTVWDGQTVPGAGGGPPTGSPNWPNPPGHQNNPGLPTEVRVSCGEPSAQQGALRPQGEAPDHSAEDPGPGCYVDVAGLLSGQPIYPLQKALTYTYDTSRTVWPLGEDAPEILRDVLMATQETHTHNGRDVFTESLLEVTYDVSPYRTPLKSRLSTSDGLARTQETRWKYHDAPGVWAFIKVQERKLDESEAEVLRTEYDHEGSSPFLLKEVRQCSPSSGCTRSRSFDYAGSSNGQPSSITDEQGTTKYTYYDEFEDGTGQLRTSSNQAGPYRAAGTERYTYDVMGRVLQYTDPTGVVTEHAYDPLGEPSKTVLPKQTPQEYTYHNVGSPGTGRSASDLASAQRTVRTQEVAGQAQREVTFWDGFYRRFRFGHGVSGAQDYVLDLNGDGKPEHKLTVPDDAVWFADRNAVYRLVDLRLNAKGREQCVSKPYLDGRAPAGWSTQLWDALDRTAFVKDFSGFRSWTTRDVVVAGGETTLREDTISDLSGELTTRLLDALERVIETDHSGLLVSLHEYDTWDAEVRRTDGRGFQTIWERDAWQQVEAECHQLDPSVVATSHACPATGWPTLSTTYDGYGRVTSVTDANGNTVEMLPSSCPEAGRIEYPDEGGGKSFEQWSFDAACRPEEKLERNGSLTLYGYGAAGRLEQIVSAKGMNEERVQRRGYDDKGRQLYVESGRGIRTYTLPDHLDRPLRQVTPAEMDGSGVVASTFTYTVHGELLSSTDPTGHETTYTYDLMGRRTSESWESEICDPATLVGGNVGWLVAPHTRHFAYDSKGRKVAEVEPNGARREFEYDAVDRRVREYATDLGNRTQVDPAVYREWVYDETGNVTISRSFLGIETVTDYDGLGRKVDRWTPTGTGDVLRTHWEYDDNGNVVRVVAPAAYDPSACVKGAKGLASFSTDYTYTALDQLLTTTYPADAHGDRHQETRSYDKAGRLVERTDPRGQTTTFVVDALGRVTRRILPDLTDTETVYDANGNAVEVINELGLSSTHVFDALDRLVRSTSASGVVSEQSYSPRGELVRVETLVEAGTERWEGRSYQYAASGQQIAEARTVAFGTTPVVAATQPVVDTCHDFLARERVAQDANGNLRASGWDNRGRLSVTRLHGSTPGNPANTVYVYDDDDRLLQVRSPFGGSGPAEVVTDYTWDDAGRKRSERFDQAAASTHWERDANGNACETVDLSAGTELRRIDRAFDARGLELTRAGDDSIAAEFGYDEAGNLTYASDASGAWELELDAMGRVELQTQFVARLGMHFKTGYAYHPDGRVAVLSYPDVAGFWSPEHKTTELDGLTGLTTLVVTGVSTVASAVEHDAGDRIVGFDVGNGNRWTAVRDEWGRLAELAITGGGVDAMRYSYGYDDAGNMLEQNDLVRPDYSFQVSFDNRNRVSAVASPSLSGLVQYTYNDRDLIEDEIHSTGGGASKSFYYGGDGNLAQLVHVGAPGPPTDYETDEFGNRQRTFAGGTPTKTYKHDFLNRLRAVETPSGVDELVYAHDTRRVESSDTVFLYGLGRLPLAELTLDANDDIVDVRYNVYLGERLVQTVGTSGVSHVGTNHQASPVVVMDDAGAVVDRRAFGPFGQDLDPATAGAVSIGFQGNAETAVDGLVLMHHRHYDPETGAFVEADPTGFDGGPSRYAFVGANPLGATDRWGLSEDLAAPLQLADAYDRVPTTGLSHLAEALVTQAQQERQKAADLARLFEPIMPKRLALDVPPPPRAEIYSASGPLYRTRHQATTAALIDDIQGDPIGYGQSALTACGATPTPAGVACDGVNGVIYALRGEPDAAAGALFAAAVPGPSGSVGSFAVELALYSSDAEAAAFRKASRKWQGAPRSARTVEAADGTEVVKRQYKAKSYLHQEGDLFTLARHPHRAKISGRAQKTGLGHATRSLRVADAYARDSSVARVYLDTSWKGMGLGNSKRRPDVTVVFHDKRVIAIEVPSASDYRSGGLQTLRDRNLEAMQQLPAGYTGQYQVIHSTKAP